jgi:hypothetical protein
MLYFNHLRATELLKSIKHRIQRNQQSITRLLATPTIDVIYVLQQALDELTALGPHTMSMMRIVTKKRYYAVVHHRQAEVGADA